MFTKTTGKVALIIAIILFGTIFFTFNEKKDEDLSLTNLNTLVGPYEDNLSKKLDIKENILENYVFPPDELEVKKAVDTSYKFEFGDSEREAKIRAIPRFKDYDYSYYDLTVKDNKLFMRGEAVDGINDPETFKIINGKFFEDKTAVYFIDDREAKILPGVEPQDFILLDFSSRYSSDGKSVYYESEKIEEADLQTFELIDSYPSATIQTSRSYAKDAKNVFFSGELLKEADTSSFEVLVDSLLADKNFVYFGREQLYGIDPKTARLVNGFIADGTTHFIQEDGTKLSVVEFEELKQYENTIYIVNDNTVIKRAISAAAWGPEYLNTLEGVDPKTFELLENDYSRDAHNVYSPLGIRIEGADPDSFLVVHPDYVYMRDANSIYYDGIKIDGVNPDEFELITKLDELKYKEPYSKDSKNLFYKGVKLKNIDLDSFYIQRATYGTLLVIDADTVYYYGTELVGMNPLRITVSPGPVITDGNITYWAVGNCHFGSVLTNNPQSIIKYFGSIGKYRPPC